MYNSKQVQVNEMINGGMTRAQSQARTGKIEKSSHFGWMADHVGNYADFWNLYNWNICIQPIYVPIFRDAPQHLNG